MPEDTRVPSSSARPAQPRDLPVLAIFERELAKLSFPDDPILDLKYHEEKLTRALASDPEGMVVLTDDATAEIAAWLWMGTRKTLATGERYGVVRSIYVRPEYRGRGLGSSLAEYARRYFDRMDVAKVYAKLHAENAAGIRLLEKVGFEELHVTMEYRSQETGDRKEEAAD
jgi:ribosomal protein S18 acetylase RimI-like enzyme